MEGPEYLAKHADVGGGSCRCVRWFWGRGGRGGGVKFKAEINGIGIYEVRWEEFWVVICVQRSIVWDRNCMWCGREEGGRWMYGSNVALVNMVYTHGTVFVRNLIYYLRRYASDNLAQHPPTHPHTDVPSRIHDIVPVPTHSHPLHTSTPSPPSTPRTPQGTRSPGPRLYVVCRRLHCPTLRLLRDSVMRVYMSV